MKKLCLFFVLLVIPIITYADAVEIEGLYYNLNKENKTAAVVQHPNFNYGSRYYGKIVVPDAIVYEDETYTINAIGDNAFLFCSDIISISVPQSIESIGVQAFYGLNNITSIIIPNGVKSLGGYAFGNCKSLTTIEIPKSVTSIGECVINGCNNLESLKVDNDNQFYDSRDDCNAIVETATNKIIAGCNVSKIPSSIKILGSYSFNGCTFKRYSIPDNVEQIEESAFSSCDSLEEIALSKSITTISDNCFSNDYSLKIIDIPEGVKSIGRNAFISCRNLQNVVLHNSIETIGASAFAGCNMSKLVLPKTISNIGYGAFSGNSSLEDVYCLSTSVPQTESSIFYNTNVNRGTLYVLESLVDNFKYVHESWSEFGTIKGITSEEADSVYAASLVIPNSIDSVEIDGICYELTPKGAIVISNKKKYQGDISIPSEVKYEGSSYKVIEVGDKAFFNCVDLKSLVLPNVHKLGKYAFSSCQRLKELILPQNLESIDDGCFNNCQGLESIEIPDNVNSIGEGIFACCISLNTVIIGEGTTEIPQYMFDSCEKLSTIVLPNNLKYVKGGAFQFCTNLKTITLPAKIDYIGKGVFNGCNQLMDVYCMAVIPPTSYSFSMGSFDASKATLHVPSGTIDAYMNSSMWNVFGNIVQIDGDDYDPTKEYKSVNTGFYYCDLYNSTKEAIIVHCPDNYVYNGFLHIPEYVQYLGNAYKVTGIGEGAFTGSDISIQILSCVSKFGAKAFSGCKLEKMYYYAENIPEVSGDLFDDTNLSNSILYVPDGLVDSYKAIWPWNQFGTIVGLYDSGISYTIMNNGIKSIHSIDGTHHKTLKKGLNIIRMDNGKTKKVVVK